MKTSQKLFAAGAITALSFSWALHAQERPSQSEPSSPEAQQQEIRERLQEQRQQQQQQAQEAQQQQQQEFGARQSQQKKSSTMATELKGTELKTQSGESLGKVEDVAVNLESGQLSFLLVASEGGGSEWTPVPAPAIEMKKEGGQTELTVNIEQQKWEQVPKVKEEEVAQLGQEQRARQIYQLFGEEYQSGQQERQFGSPDRQSQREQPQSAQPGQEQSSSAQSPQGQSSSAQSPQEQSSSAQSPQERQQQAQQQAAQQERSQQSEYGQQQQPRSGQASQRQSSQSSQSSQKGKTSLGSKLMEAKIKDQQQEELGQISDFILNLQEGRVDFVLIEAEQAEGKYAVAPQAFRVTSEQEVQLNITQQDLQQAQALREEQIDQRAQQARMKGAQAQQSPEVFRWEGEAAGTQFGSPEREREEKQKAKEKKEKKEKAEQR